MTGEAHRMCSAAIAYADLGLAVLPLWSVEDNGRCRCGRENCKPGKHPFGRNAPNGLKDATLDGSVICSSFNDGEPVNVGILTGEQSGIIVLDVDAEHGGFESLGRFGEMPQTATVETGGGGRHYYFKWPGGNIRNSAGKLGDGLDIRANAGYVVAPPSRHTTGRQYRWLIDPRAGFAELPKSILDWMTERPTGVVKTPATLGEIIPIGKRDTTLTSLAGTMRRRGMTEGEILIALREVNKRCEKNLPDSDLQRIAGSIGTREPAPLSSQPRWEPQGLEPFVPFPVASLPAPVARFVDRAARAIGCDPSYVALPLLAGLASAIGNTRRIQLKRNWTEPAIVWAAIVGESGTLKSPALEVALRPVRKRQHAAMMQFAEALADHKVELMQYEKELTAWKRSTETGDPPPKPEEPQAERCWCDDTTIEALAVLLLQNRRGLLLVRDELSGWLGSFDRYRQYRGADAAKWLEMFGGRPIVVDRKSGPSKTVYVHRAAVSVTGSIQPDILRRALGAEHRENGLAARLLLACPPHQPKRWTDGDISPDVETLIYDIFDKLYSLQLAADGERDDQPLDLPLTPDAKAAWVRFYDEHAQEQAELTGDLAAIWSKLEGYAARLALVVHLVRWAAGDQTLDNPNIVDERSINAGVELSDWFGHEARRVYAILGESEEQRDQRRLIELIRAKDGGITVREVQRSSRRFATAGDAEQALEDLVGAGLGRWEHEKTNPTGGRPTRRFILAPRVDVDKTMNSSTVSAVVSTSTVSAETGYEANERTEDLRR